MTANDRSGGDREGSRLTPESHDPPSESLENPAASRATLVRRLRAVERALAGTEGIEFETAAERAVDPDELDAMADRLDALHCAVRTIGQCLVARDRARRRDDGTESVRRAVEALAEVETGTGTGTGAIDEVGTTAPGESGRTGTDGTGTGDSAAGSGGFERGVETDGGAAPVEESPAEWLDRVAVGGVAPPPVE